MPSRSRRRRSPRHVARRGDAGGLRFEALEPRNLLAADFGDAADSNGSAYPTASHEAVGPLLGLLRDATPFSYNALGTGDAQDEDGVTFGTLRVGQTASIIVHVANAPAGARLDAWMDFGRDTSFTTAGDQIVDNLAVTAGDNSIAFSIPATVASGHYFARFRLSTAGNLNSTGTALDGEVEDYLVPIAHADSGPFAGSQPVSFTDASQAVPTDLDGDGDLDLLLSSFRWIENIDGRYGTEIVITNSTASAVAPADVDGDGDMDFFANNSGLRWYENDGRQNFTSRSIDSTAPLSMFAVDLDQDGDLDLVAGFASSTAAWYVNNGGQSFTKVVLPGTIRDVRSISVVDMDVDGDLDVLAATSVDQTIDDSIEWLENNGSESFTPRQVAPTNASLRMAVPADLDGDGDVDVVAAVAGSGGGVWYENDGNQAFSFHALNATGWAAESVAVADLDGDGDIDVAASGLTRVAWYENDGEEGFTSRIIAAPSGTHLAIAAADVDGDGRLDLVTSGTGAAPVAWHRQLAEYDFGDASQPYGVYLQDNGARHNAVGPRLGGTRDAEADGAHSPAGAEAEDDGVLVGGAGGRPSVGHSDRERAKRAGGREARRLDRLRRRRRLERRRRANRRGRFRRRGRQRPDVCNSQLRCRRRHIRPLPSQYRGRAWDRGRRP